MRTKVNSTIVIAGVFVFMILILYFMKKKGEAKLVVPTPSGTPIGKYPDWRILPYDPYKVGTGKVYDPYTLRMGIAPKPIAWSSKHGTEPYDIPG